jgi:3-oxoacyl-[acyl-carrier protein] reductase
VRLDKALAELNAPGGRGFVADICKPSEVSALVGSVVNAFGGIDIVVSNAGTHLPGRLSDISSDALLRHFSTKVLGAWELARCVAPHMTKQGEGRFIVIIGQAGKVPQANAIASTVINAAQHSFVKSLSDDLAPHGILVNAVCPSRIKSPLTEGLVLHNEIYYGRSLEQQQSQWGAEVPLGHWGTADDIANAVAFLASARAGFICGTNIDVDGGHQRMIF